jgi:pyruvate kinase
VGAHPVGAVEVMNRVARETEGYLWRRGAFGTMGTTPGAGGSERPLDVREAVSRATSQLSRDLMVRAIVVFTRSGWSAGMVASSRPQAPVLAVSGDPRTCRRMNLLWGVVPICHPFGDSADELHELARDLARESGLAGPGDVVLRVWGFHSEVGLNVPTVSVLTV